jgi:hypothetical protein
MLRRMAPCGVDWPPGGQVKRGPVRAYASKGTSEGQVLEALKATAKGWGGDNWQGRDVGEGALTLDGRALRFRKLFATLAALKRRRGRRWNAWKPAGHLGWWPSGVRRLDG